MKVIVFTVEGAFLPVALKLQQAGHEVIVGQIQDKKMTLTKDEESNYHPEAPEAKKRRLSMYDGLIKKYDAVDVLKAMKKMQAKDYLVFTETNCTFQFTEVAQKMGFTGLIPTEADRKMEVNREEAKDIVEKYYPDLEIMEHHEFKTIEEGIAFLQETENIYVLKSLGDAGETVVSKIDDPEIAKKEIISALEVGKEAYEQHGFMLEQKILDTVELTPQIVFWDGKPVYTSLDIETKTLGGHERGPNYGCAINLIVKTNLDDKINQIAFPQYIYDLAKKRKGMFIIDAGILLDRRTGKAYFSEYCPMRLGWDAFPTELAMSGEKNDMASPYFESLIKGKDPLKRRFGVGVRLFNLNKDDERYTDAGLKVTFDEAIIGDGMYFYDVKKENEDIVSAGFQDDLGVATGSGNTIKEALEEAYGYANKVGFTDLYFKAHEDALSTEYPQAILNRLKYAVEEGFIQDQNALTEIDLLTTKDASAAGEVRTLKEQLEDKDQELSHLKEAIRQTIYDA